MDQSGPKSQKAFSSFFHYESMCPWISRARKAAAETQSKRTDLWRKGFNKVGRDGVNAQEEKLS